MSYKSDRRRRTLAKLSRQGFLYYGVCDTPASERTALMHRCTVCGECLQEKEQVTQLTFVRRVFDSRKKKPEPCQNYDNITAEPGDDPAIRSLFLDMYMHKKCAARLGFGLVEMSKANLSAHELADAQRKCLLIHNLESESEL